ncbi:MAG: hypothetical protein OXH90_07070 [Paracoccaceae bacterium]|nr:hypothetical protein [Paracoccaceae bacterium]MDE2915860.1 hypothetical protein [Paracoccaceae bacterium]
MWEIGRKILVILGFAEFVWAGYKWWNEVEVSIGPIAFGPAEWLALSVAGVLTVLFAGYQFLKYPFAWIRTWSPTYRLKKLEPLIREHRQNTENNTSDTDLIAERHSLEYQLIQLKILVPDIYDDQDWEIFLMELEHMAKHGLIKKARNFSKMYESAT